MPATGYRDLGLVRRRLILAVFLFALMALGSVQRANAQLTAASGSVVVGDRVVITLQASVGSIGPAERAGIVNGRLERVLSEPELRPDLLTTQTTAEGEVLLKVGDFPILQVTQADAAKEDAELDKLAEAWASTLRKALIEAKPFHHADNDVRHISFLPLLLVSFLAFLVPFFTARLGKLVVPVVVGEILMGMLIGRSGLGLVHYDSWLQFLAEFGFAFLMFLSGLEVDVGLLQDPNLDESRAKTSHAWRRNPLVISGISFAITLLLAGAFSHGMKALGLIQRPWLMMLVLSTTSLGIVVPVLKQKGLTGSRYGQTLLVTATVADFATMVLITIVAGFLSRGLTWRLLLVLLLVAAFAAAVRLGRWAITSPRVAEAFSRVGGASKTRLRGSLALMLVFVALSEQLGTEVILGAFLAGLLLSILMRSNGVKLREELEALGFGFFIPIFFIMVGVRFDLGALIARPESMLLAVWLTLGAVVIKLGGALPFRWIVPWRSAFAGGLLMSAGLSLMIAAAEIGLRMGLFSETDKTAIVCVALVTGVAAPILFQSLLPQSAKPEEEAPAPFTIDDSHRSIEEPCP